MSDILFAATPDGVRLPIIDITHPAFAVPDTAEKIAELGAAALREERGRGPLQRLFIGLVLKALSRQSRLIAALQAANDGYLSGIPTYVLKLGPDNLVPPYDTTIDRRVVGTPIVSAIRLRLHQVAELLAEGLAPRLAADAVQPLHILEIAGGPSADGLNALLLLERRGLLAGRRIRIVIYDIDVEGPAFAANMLSELKTGPLAGRDIEIEHFTGDWSDRAALARVLDRVPQHAILAATSEGGLFEYGEDADIAGVLTALAPRAVVVTGSVTRNDELNRLMKRHSRAKTIPRGLARFDALIAPTGWRIDRSRANPLSDQVALVRI